MPWPTPQDYNEAVQNPNLAFADSELQIGHAELDRLGLPRPRTGGFASVYRMQCGLRDWAVRCFLRDFHDQQQRYAAISDHLSRMRVPYTVGFTFLRQGIRVRGQWYPILKMEWVQGEPLNVYIEKHLGSPNTLLSLASRWVQLVQTLQQASLAHGDLQHGNVFVVQGDLRLIDYDGMYVPALSDEVSHEVGHRNYQHPLRTESDFGPYLDNFPAWVIYMSLIALSVDPRMWARFSGGDECLLFRRKDFEQPETSDLLHALELSSDERIRSVATLFKSLLYLGPQQIPSLDGKLETPIFTPKKLFVPGSSWVDDHVKINPPQVTSGDTLGSPEPTTTEVDPSWIFDFLGPSVDPRRSLSFENSMLRERVVIGISGVTVLLLILAIPGDIMRWELGGLATVLAAFINSALLVYSYHLEPNVKKLHILRLELRTINGQIRSILAEVRTTERAKAKHRKKHASDQANIVKEQNIVEAREAKEFVAREKAFQLALSSLHARRQALNRQQTDELGKIQRNIGTKVADLSRQIALLVQAESTELTNALKAQQEQHIITYLRRFTLASAHIQGVGSSFKSRLNIAGFQAAADIEYYAVQRVRGIGPSRAASLIAWRKSIESKARATMPQTLSSSDTATIQQKYRSQRLPLEDERGRAQRLQKNEENAVRANYQGFLKQLDEEVSALNVNAKRELDEIRARYAQQYDSFRQTLTKLANDSAYGLREMDSEISEARKRLFSLHWEKEKETRRLKTFEGVRFSKYVKRVFVGSRAA